MIPSGRQGKKARKRSNKAMKKKQADRVGEVTHSCAGTRPRLHEAATEVARHLREWATHNGWVPRKVKVGNEASCPRPAPCWLVAPDGMARGMLSLCDIWVATVKEWVYLGRSTVECLSMPHYAGRGDAMSAMGISPAVVASALRYRYAKWAFRHVEDFRVAEHPRQFPKAFQRGLQAKDVRANTQEVVGAVGRLVA